MRSTWPRERHLALVARARRFEFLRDEIGGTLSQAALAYCLSEESIAAVIPGAMTVAELTEDVAAARLAPLAPAIRAEVRRRQLAGEAAG